MSDREKFIVDETERLNVRQAELVAQGTPDEFIPVQIAQLGNVCDVSHQGRKWNVGAASNKGAGE